MNFFGRKKNTTTSSGTAAATSKAKSGNVEAGSALQNLKTRTMTLEKRIEFLEKKAHSNLVEAKRHSQAKNKRGAMQALKRKKMHEKEIEKLRVAVHNLEQQAFAIENASVTMDIVAGMKAGKAAVESIQKQVNLDDVEDLKDDIAEQMQMQQEIDDILSNPIGDMGDDDELLAELDELDELDEQDELAGLESELGSVSVREPAPSLDLPNAPAGAIPPASKSKAKPVEEDEDAEALAALEAEMAM